TPCRAASPCSTATTAPATTPTPAGSPPRCSATWWDKQQRRGEMTDGLVGYLAPDGFLSQLLEELGGDARETYGNLVLAPAPARPVAWVANVWHDPQRLEIASIGD